MYTQRTGKYDKVDAYEDNDMLKGLLAQLDEEGLSLIHICSSDKELRNFGYKLD